MDPLRIIDGNSWDIACFSFFGSLPHVAIAAACFTVLTCFCESTTSVTAKRFHNTIMAAEHACLGV